MIYLKSKEEIRIIKEGGRRLAAILNCLLKKVAPGVATDSLEELADKLIREIGGRPAFKNYPMGGGLFFPSVLCISINNDG